MSFPPTKRLKNMMMNILSFLFTVLLFAGCVAQKTENTKTANRIRPHLKQRKQALTSGLAGRSVPFMWI